MLSAILVVNGSGRVQRQARGVKVCCPVHGDTNPSCSITYDAGRGKTSVKCFACGDDNTPILAAARLTIADLYDEPRAPSTGGTPPPRRSHNGVVELPATPRKPAGAPPQKNAKKAKDNLQHRKVCEYLYPDVAGNRVGKVGRFDLLDDTGARVDKTFRPSRFDPDTRRWNTGGFDPLVYRAPQVAAAIEAGALVYLVEGEKDADRGAEALGLVTTTNAGGATSFSPDHARQLAGARVVAVLDRDLAGYERGVRLGELLFDPDHPAAELRIVEPAVGNDLADHIDAGHGADALVDIDPAEQYVALTPREVDQALADGKLAKAHAILAKARTLLDKVINTAARPALAGGLHEAESRLPANEAEVVDELARRREHHQHRGANGAPLGVDDDPPAWSVVEPRWRIPSSQGSWAYATGGDGDDIPRGVYRLAGEAWQLVAPLPHVLERLTRRDGHATRRGISYRIAMRPLADATDVAIVADDDVKDGTWAELLDISLSADDKIVKAVAYAIRRIARAADTPLSNITPGWTADEQFTMPSPDVLGGGYGELVGTEANARVVWREVAEIAGRNPKVALAFGAALGGLFVKPLLIPIGSFWVHLAGRSQAGKTTTQRWGASLFGDPAGVVETFNASGKGMAYRFGDLACLTLFPDELRASADLISPVARENAILSIMEGNKRRVATRTQGSRTSPPWHGVVLSTGNPSLLDGITEEAVWARVLEIPAPITDSADDCTDLRHLLSPESPLNRDEPVVRRLAERTQAPITKAYGWPLHWLRQDLNLDRFRDHVADARRELPLPPDGVPRTMGLNLCMVIAGAAELDRLLGTTTVRPAALAAARQTLGDLLDELTELGATPGQRLLAAVIQALISRVSSYPTRDMVRNAFPDTDETFGRTLLPRDVEGFVIAKDREVEGDIAILTHKLREIAAAAGITDTRPGLRELAKAKVLVRSNEQGGKLARDIRVGPIAKLPVYVFRLGEDVLAAFDDVNPPTGDSPREAVTRTGDLGPEPEPSEVLSPVSPPVPGPVEPTGDSSVNPVTRTVGVANTLNEGSVPGVPGYGGNVVWEATVHQETLLEGAAGPVWIEHLADQTLRPQGTCRVCGVPAPSRDQQGPVHAMCALNPTGPPPPAGGGTAEAKPAAQAQQSGPQRSAPASAPPTSPAPSGLREDRVTLTGACPPRPTGYRAACLVLDPSGIYLPDGVRYHGAPIRDALDILTLGDQMRIGHPHGLGQLILTDSMCVQLGLVAEADPDTFGEDARKQVMQRLGDLGHDFLQRARAAGWSIGDFRVENRAHRASDNRVLNIVLAPYGYLWTKSRDDVLPLSALDPANSLSEEEYAAEAARLMGYLAHLLGGPWRSSAVQVGWDLFDRGQRARKNRHGHVLTQPATLPDLTGGVTVDHLDTVLTWSRWTKQAPAGEADRARLAKVTHAVHVDRKAAWLASGAQSVLGYLTDDDPRMRHHTGANDIADLLQRPEAVPAGLYRLRLPAADNPAVPPLHPDQSTGRGRWLWVPAPFVSALLADDDPSNNVIGWGAALDELLTPGEEDEGKQPEAWTFPAQGRLLDGLWSTTLRDARYALDTLADQDRGDNVATGLIKHVYSGFLQTTQNPRKQQEVTDEQTGTTRLVDGPRAWHHQATWRPTTMAHHYAWQWNLVRRAVYNGLLVASLQIDEVVILTDDPDTVTFGQMKGRVGQYKRKRLAGGAMARQLTDEHRAQLAAGVPAHELRGGDTA